MALLTSFVSTTEELILRFFILRSYCSNHNFSLRHTLRSIIYNLFQ
ncbi:MAG TPA: hypothetical protein VK750_06170 [Cytophagaceae bacterium]|nr:hypothetical protein [Cytophagaceae bacterium]